MRLVVWLLLFVNVALFGYFRLSVPQPMAIAGHEPLQPEKLVLLTQQQLDALPKKAPSAEVSTAAVESVVSTACYEWGGFSSGNLSRAQQVLQKFAVEPIVRQMATGDATRYWVFIPPRKTPEEVQTKSDELRALGVTDFYVVQEPQWRNAISLGVFKDEKLAENLLQSLQARGVKSAIKGVRNQESGQSSFYLKHLASAVADEISRLQPDFPGSELKQVACQ